jgi:hypothetical protein
VGGELPGATVDGSCVAVTASARSRSAGKRRNVGSRTQCGPRVKIKLTVVPRDPAKVKQAMAAFAAAIAEYEAHGRTLGGEAKASRATGTRRRGSTRPRSTTRRSWR